MTDEPDVLTVTEAAQLLRLRREQTVREWIWSGRLPARKVGKSWLIRREDIDRLRGMLGAEEADEPGGLWDPDVGPVARSGRAGDA